MPGTRDRDQVFIFYDITGGQKDISLPLLGGLIGTTTLETIWEFLLMLHILLPHEPTLVLLGVCPTETQAHIHQNTHTHHP